MCEPYWPRENPFVDFSHCPMGVQNAIWHLENVSFSELPSSLQEPTRMTRRQFTDIIRPILEQWFQFSHNKYTKINEVIHALINDPEREYLDKPLDRGSVDADEEESETAEAIRQYNDDDEDHHLGDHGPTVPVLTVHQQRG
jgi:hypothetical protein